MDYSNNIALTGSNGTVKWAYYDAAVVSSWSLNGTSLTATVVSSDTYRCTQAPLTFCVRTPKGHTWTWTLNSLQISGTSLSATVAEE